MLPALGAQVSGLIPEEMATQVELQEAQRCRRPLLNPLARERQAC
jgi:hypothetical protein